MSVDQMKRTTSIRTGLAIPAVVALGVLATLALPAAVRANPVTLQASLTCGGDNGDGKPKDTRHPEFFWITNDSGTDVQLIEVKIEFTPRGDLLYYLFDPVTGGDGRGEGYPYTTPDGKDFPANTVTNETVSVVDGEREMTVTFGATTLAPGKNHRFGIDVDLWTNVRPWPDEDTLDDGTIFIGGADGGRTWVYFTFRYYFGGGPVTGTLSGMLDYAAAHISDVIVSGVMDEGGVTVIPAPGALLLGGIGLGLVALMRLRRRGK